MVEYFYYLLSGCHLFNVTVQLAQVFLLEIEIIFALLSALPDIGKHQNVAGKYNQ